MKPTLQLTPVALLLLALAHPAAAGPIIFDNSGARVVNAYTAPPNFDSDPLVGAMATLAPLSSDVPITEIQVFTPFAAGIQVHFLVFDETVSSSNPVVNVSMMTSHIFFLGTWVPSPDFSFTLLAGHQYDVGYAADQLTRGELVSNFTQNGITANGFAVAEFSTFYNSFVSIFFAPNESPFIRLEGPSPATAAPEPASLTLLSIGLAGWIGGRILRRRRPLLARRAGISCSA